MQITEKDEDDHQLQHKGGEPRFLLQEPMAEPSEPADKEHHDKCIFGWNKGRWIFCSQGKKNYILPSDNQATQYLHLLISMQNQPTIACIAHRANDVG